MQGEGETTSVPYQVDRLMNHQSTASPTLITDRPRSSVPLAHEVMNPGDSELEDLIFCWRRVSDPKSRRIALQLIRSMAS